MQHEGTLREAWFHFLMNDINKLIKGKHSDFPLTVKGSLKQTKMNAVSLIPSDSMKSAHHLVSNQ